MNYKDCYPHKTLLTKMILVLGLCLTFLTSCVEESPRSGKLIEQFGEAEEEGCSTYYDVSSLRCRNSSCATGTHEATADEISQVKSELDELLENEDLTQEEYEDIINNVESAEVICVDGSGILRPDGEVFLSGDLCACQNGLPASINSCEATCAAKTATANITLFGKVTLGPNILLNEELGNLHNWCNAEITGADLVGPGCKLEFTDTSNNTDYAEINIPAGSNTFSVDLSTTSMKQNENYIIRIVERESGSMVASDEKQIRLTPYEEEDTDPAGPLNITPVSQYSCILRQIATNPNNGEVSYIAIAKQHYYFPSGDTPPSLPDDTPRYVCHDVQTYGEDDSVLYPRLEVTQPFVMWNQDDTRFNDTDSDGVIDVNEKITEDYKIAAGRENDSTVDIQLFSVFEWNYIPQIDGWRSSTKTNLGLMMIPFVNNQNLAECPKESDYIGDNPLYNVIGDYVGVDTEGLYMAESEPYQDNQGNTIIDIIMIKESDLKQVWFYFEDGKFLIPDTTTSRTKTIHFFYPLDKSAPYIQKASQVLYTVRYPDAIGTDGVTTGIVTGNRPPDNRFACIPASTSTD